MASSAFPGASAPASDLLRRSCSEMTGGGFPLRSLGRARLGAAGLWMGRRRRGEVGVTVVAKIRKWKKHDYPWPAPGEIDPNVKGGSVSYLSHFKPLKDKPRPVTLPFEKPLTDLEKKIADVRKMADETGLDFSDQILSLEEKYQQALKDLYTHLTPIQRLSIARHPNRPTFLDHVLNMTDKWVELHGDRAGYDDPAIVTGIGTIEGRNYMLMGHQKGRNTKENIERNFGMPTPHGYRKALRMMRYADHHGFPIITFIDTPGAYADLKSEELGQGEAIAQNLRTMFGLKVPIVSVVIGEGGSGGALAIGCSNKLFMLQNAVFYVASPEACAAILWKTSKAAPKAAEKLRITATELCKLKVADGIIPEPLGGAHADPSWTSQQIKIAIVEAMNEFLKMDAPAILHHRMLKFRHIGGFIEGEPVDPAKKVNMKKKEESVVPEAIQTEPDTNIEDEIEKLKQQILKFKSDASAQPPDVDLNELIGKLKKEVDQEFAEAAKSMGFMERLDTLRNEVAQATSSLEQPLDSSLKEKIVKLKQEFNESLPQCPNFASLNYKLDMLKEISRAKEVSERNDKVSSFKQDINEAFKMVWERPDMKVKSELLKTIISDAGVSKPSDLNDALKEKYLKIKREVESELMNTFKSLQLSVERVAISEGNDKVSLKQDINKAFKMVSERPDMKAKLELLKTEISDAGVSKPSDLNDALKEKILKMIGGVGSELINTLKSLQLSAEGVDTDVREKMEELDDQIAERIEDVVNSSELNSQIEALKLEVAKAGSSPDPESKGRIEAMKQQIKQNLSQAVSSSQLIEKFNDLKRDIARREESSTVDAEVGSAQGLDGDLGGTTPDSSKVEINVGTNSRS